MTKKVAIQMTILLIVALCAGCASWHFKPVRSQTFVNVDAQRLLVEYGREKRTETLPDGLVCTYEGKVRLQLQDGRRVVLYQTLATVGNRYLSADKHYEFIEKVPYCLVRHQGRLIYEGIYTRR